MSDRRVIKRSRVAMHLPFTQTATAFLLLDHFKAPGYLWGVIGTVVALVWIGAIINIAREDEVDPFPTRRAP